MSLSGGYPGQLPPRAARSGTRPVRYRILRGKFRLMLPAIRAAARYGPCCLVAKDGS
jgi:hypothetical protein